MKREKENNMRKMKLFMVKVVYFTVFLCVSNGVLASTCRNPAVKHRFDVLNGYPHGRTGYVVDHICALSVGGLDIVTNMQYQTVVEGKKKDRIESTAKGRLLYCTSKNSLPYRSIFNCK